MAMCPHGTSSAERGSSRQTAHGSGGSSSATLSAAIPPAGTAPSSFCSFATGEAPSGDMANSFSGEGEPPADFLRMPRFGSAGIGSGQRSRWRDWYVVISCSVSLRR